MPNRKLPPNPIIIKEYRSGQSCGAIAEKYGVAPVTVTCLLQRIGEPRRTAAEAAKIRSQSGRTNPARYWLGKKQPAAMVERRVSRIRGKNHYLWKGGKERRPYREMVAKNKCRSCGSRLNLCIHHKNFDHYDNNPKNLEVLCVGCHMSLHKTAYWKAKREGRTPPRSTAPHHWQKGGRKGCQNTES